MSQIQSNHITGKRGQIKQNIADALETNIRMKDQFSRPDDDWLFRAAYSHQREDCDCSACDLNQLINDRPLRETDEPFVHYGLIASGNQVIKDAQIRDKIAKELDILCFEMEGGA